MIQIAVLAGARREQLTTKTVSLLDGRGGAERLHGPKTVFYSAPASYVAPSIPLGWTLVRRVGPWGGGADFAWMISQLRTDRDALLFEDDVYPMTDAVVKMSDYQVATDHAFVSFYDFASQIKEFAAKSLNPLTEAYYGTQAIRLPAWLIAKMQSGAHLPINNAQDAWLWEIAKRELKYIRQTHSYVQHVGRVSLCSAGADLVGNRAPSSTFPEPFELEPPNDIGWCSFHGCFHKDATICPILGE